jgi:hypothetical protein
MRKASQLTREAQRLALLARQGAEREHVVRAYDDAIFFTFAAIAVDHGYKFAGVVLAVRFGGAHRISKRNAVCRMDL